MKTKIHHLNFCRSAVRQAQEMLRVPSAPRDMKKMSVKIADLCSLSTKFVLPVGGHLIEGDLDLKAIDDDVILRLPFPSVALEFPSREGLKLVVFAREWEGPEGSIAIELMFQNPQGLWVIDPDSVVCIIDSVRTHENGRREVATFITEDRLHDYSEYVNLATVPVLSLINALSCSNVKIERSDPPKKAKKPKGALPFDSYHFLTIDVGRKPSEAGPGLLTTHRSPREHIRRGHIRRYESGLKVWVNSHVVGARSGGGKIAKDYGVINSRLGHGQRAVHQVGEQTQHA